MLETKANERCTVGDLLEHPFIQNYLQKDFLKDFPDNEEVHILVESYQAQKEYDQQFTPKKLENHSRRRIPGKLKRIREKEEDGKEKESKDMMKQMRLEFEQRFRKNKKKVFKKKKPSWQKKETKNAALVENEMEKREEVKSLLIEVMNKKRKGELGVDMREKDRRISFKRKKRSEKVIEVGRAEADEEGPEEEESKVKRVPKKNRRSKREVREKRRGMAIQIEESECREDTSTQTPRQREPEPKGCEERRKHEAEAPGEGKKKPKKKKRKPRKTRSSERAETEAKEDPMEGEEIIEAEGKNIKTQNKSDSVENLKEKKNTKKRQKEEKQKSAPKSIEELKESIREIPKVPETKAKEPANKQEEEKPKDSAEAVREKPKKKGRKLFSIKLMGKKKQREVVLKSLKGVSDKPLVGEEVSEISCESMNGEFSELVREHAWGGRDALEHTRSERKIGRLFESSGPSGRSHSQERALDSYFIVPGIKLIEIEKRFNRSKDREKSKFILGLGARKDVRDFLYTRRVFGRIDEPRGDRSGDNGRRAGRFHEQMMRVMGGMLEEEWEYELDKLEVQKEIIRKFEQERQIMEEEKRRAERERLRQAEEERQKMLRAQEEAEKEHRQEREREAEAESETEGNEPGRLEEESESMVESKIVSGSENVKLNICETVILETEIESKSDIAEGAREDSGKESEEAIEGEPIEAESGEMTSLKGEEERGEDEQNKVSQESLENDKLDEVEEKGEESSELMNEGDKMEQDLAEILGKEYNSIYKSEAQTESQNLEQDIIGQKNFMSSNERNQSLDYNGNSSPELKDDDGNDSAMRQSIEPEMIEYDLRIQNIVDSKLEQDPSQNPKNQQREMRLAVSAIALPKKASVLSFGDKSAVFEDKLDSDEERKELSKSTNIFREDYKSTEKPARRAKPKKRKHPKKVFPLKKKGRARKSKRGAKKDLKESKSSKIISKVRNKRALEIYYKKKPTAKERMQKKKEQKSKYTFRLKKQRAPSQVAPEEPMPKNFISADSGLTQSVLESQTESDMYSMADERMHSSVVRDYSPEPKSMAKLRHHRDRFKVHKGKAKSTVIDRRFDDFRVEDPMKRSQMSQLQMETGSCLQDGEREYGRKQMNKTVNLRRERFPEDMKVENKTYSGLDRLDMGNFRDFVNNFDILKTVEPVVMEDPPAQMDFSKKKREQISYFNNHMQRKSNQRRTSQHRPSHASKSPSRSFRKSAKQAGFHQYKPMTRNTGERRHDYMKERTRKLRKRSPMPATAPKKEMREEMTLDQKEQKFKEEFYTLKMREKKPKPRGVRDMEQGKAGGERRGEGTGARKSTVKREILELIRMKNKLVDETKPFLGAGVIELLMDEVMFSYQRAQKITLKDLRRINQNLFNGFSTTQRKMLPQLYNLIDVEMSILIKTKSTINF